MRFFIWGSVILVCMTYLIYGEYVVDNVGFMESKYKRALDAATYAGLKYREYSDDSYMENIASGFDDDIKINKDESLKWFYRIFFRNLGVENDELAKEELKQYIPIKAIIGYDEMYIANAKDEWVTIPYIVEINDNIYRITLKDKIRTEKSKKWTTLEKVGVLKEEKEKQLVRLIKDNINNILNDRIDSKKDKYYIDFGLSDIDLNNRIKGIGFVAFVDGMPLPTIDVDSNNKLYAVSFSGSEISR